MIKPQEVKEKIVSILQTRGPSLPIQIAKELRMSSLFVSAFLSELANEKKIKVSTLKVGGSPLYFIEGQTDKLENFHKFMHPKESEAFLMLKERKILKDSEQEPSIRVALRAIKDFAIAFKNDEDIYWRYILVPEVEVINIFNNKEKPKIEQKTEEKIVITVSEPIKTESNEDVISSTSIEKPLIESKLIEKPEKKLKKRIIEKPLIESKETISFQNPLLENIEQEKPKKEKPKSEFVINTIEFLKKHKFKILNEIDHKSKEFTCISEFETNLGPISFLTHAKDKKSVTDADLSKLLIESQKIPLPALMLYTGELSKNGKIYQEKYYSILKVKKIE